jgi:DivIVA domain-containing protein
MISASIAETHRFGRVRKNGYDPAEVDAVVARLSDALRRNDERIALLTERIDGADASADAIRKTFVAAEATRDEIIENAHTEATRIAEAARSDAEELAQGLAEMNSEIAARREKILAALYVDAERRRLMIERETAQRSTDAEWAVREAIEVRNRVVADAEAETETIVHLAESDAARIRVRIASMAQAAIALEQAAGTLASTARDGAKLIDVTAMEQLDQSEFTNGEPTVTATSGEAVGNEPLLLVAEPTEDNGETDGMPKTRYQRSTGVPLKERIKIARMSG